MDEFNIPPTDELQAAQIENSQFSNNQAENIQKLILEFPTKIGKTSQFADSGYIMIQIYDRNDAKKLSIGGQSDRNFSAVVQPDGVANILPTTSAGQAQTIISQRNSNPEVRGNLEGGGDLNFVVDSDKSILDRTILLPMPNQVEHNLDANINQKSAAGLLAGFSDPAGGLTKILKDVAPDVIGSELGKGLGSGLKNPSAKQRTLLGILKLGKGQGQAVADTVTRELGYVTNDRREMWFEGMDFRSFNFSYTFSPRNMTEAKRLQEIITTLRFYMLPTYGGNGAVSGKFFLIQPAEFKIKFMIGGKENQSIPKIDTCLLKSCKVNYSPRDKWVMLSKGEGFPPEITLTLSFIEKQLMFREKVFRDGEANKNFGGF